MKQYLELLNHVLHNGEVREDRTGTGTKSVFGYQSRYNLSSFPLLTTKKVHMRSIIYELLWFLSGSTDVKWLQERGVTIWDEWATPEQCERFGREPGDLGPVYGHQWRNFGASQDDEGNYINGKDQIQNVINEIKSNPYSRRLIVSGWNPIEANQVALPPCHTLFQFYVLGNKLSCQLYQRSGDIFLGVPFNIASYALLTMMIAKMTGLEPGEFIHTIGDAHLYLNHIEQAKLQLSREPKDPPKMRILRVSENIEDFTYEDFELVGYDPHPAIKAKVSV